MTRKATATRRWGGFLNNAGVDTVICGGIGDEAKNMLAAENIRLLSGFEGPVEDAAHAYWAGLLTGQRGSCGYKEQDHQDHDCSCEDQCH